MTVSELSVRRPVLMTMIYVLIALIAAIFLTRLEIALYPETDMPVISVMVGCEDAGPELIEQQVTKTLEDSLSSLENLDTMMSMSSEGNAVIVLQFDYGTDLDEAEEDVNSIVTMLSRVLPDWADSPQVMRMDSISTSTVMTLSLSGNYDLDTLQTIAEDDIAPLLERVEGVEQAEVFGGGDRSYKIWLDEERLHAYGLTASQVMSAVSGENIQASNGEITQNGLDYKISMDERYSSLQDIEDTVITVRNGIPIKVSDVATVSMDEDDNARESYLDGERIISISVTADSESNETTAAKAVREALPSIQATLDEGLKLEIERDSTTMISDTMNEVYNSAVQGVLFAALVIFIFLRGIKSTIIISLSMPVCILITLMCMSIADITVNSMSMAGLILGIGMIVDASIIILENTYALRLKGEQSAAAAILGSQNMFNAILASTLTTICVFLPILIFQNELGMIGIMFRDLIITVCISLGCSIFVAVTLVPALCGSILRLTTRTQKPLKNRLLRTIDDACITFENMLRNAYAKVLSYFLDHKSRLIIPLVLLFILSVQSLGSLGISLTPQMTSDDEVSLSLTMPPGTTKAVVREALFEMYARILDTVPQDAYESISVNTSQSASGSINISLPDITEQLYSPSEVEEMIRPLFKTAGSGQAWIFSGGRGLSSSGIDVEIRSDDTDAVKAASDSIAEILSKVEGTDNIESDLEDGAPQYTVKINKDAAQDLGLSASDVSDALTTALTGTTVSELTAFSNENTYDLDIIYQEEDVNTLEKLESLLIETGSGISVRLDSVAEIEESSAPMTIMREDKMRINHVTADIMEGYSANDVQNAVNQALDEKLVIPEGVTISQGGEMSDFMEYVPTLIVILLLALLLVYAVMAAQFESLVDPLIIFATVPLLLIGVVFIHITYNQDFTLFSFVGIIALIGVVVNNGIVLVDWINQLVRRDRLDVHTACLSAARSRLRPILMTTLTTIIGLIPMAFFPGEGSEMLQPIALTFIGGITTGAFLTLLLSPVLYSMLNRNRAEKVSNPESLENQLLVFDERRRKGEFS